MQLSPDNLTRGLWRARLGGAPPGRRLGLAAAAGLLACLAACQDTAPTTTIEPKAPGIEAEPRWLTFKCVKPGCDTTLDVTIRQIGERRLAIKRIVLSDSESSDFTVESQLTAPAIMEGEFNVSVRYQPKGGSETGDVKLLVTYADGSPDESENRIPPGELAVPLLRRLIGEPVLVASPERVLFGSVARGSSAEQTLTVSNAGSGNSSLAIESIESDAAEIQPVSVPTQGLGPGESMQVQLSFTPSAEAYTEAKLLIHPVGDAVEPVEVVAIGTSLPNPSISASPAEGIDFGRVSRGTPKTASVELSNRGGSDLVVSSVRVLGSSDVTVELPAGGSSLTLAPLESATLTLTLEAERAGELDANLSLQSNDPRSPSLQVPLTGMVTEPQAMATPEALDFGDVPKGWVVVKPITVQNVGWGELEVSALTLIPGSSRLFTLRSVPPLPARLERDQKLAVEIQFSAESLARFEGTLSIESNDPNHRFLEVPISGTGTTCAEGCPLDHATPSCVGNECSVLTCESGWYDTDQDPANGCECSEVGSSDPGSSCQEAFYMGELRDNDHASASYRGVLPRRGDVDVVTFHAVDGWALSENYNVQIRLDSSDPTLRMCVYWHSTGEHLSECYLEHESCPEDRYFQKSGGNGGDDDADYTVKIFRESGAAPTCISYTLNVSNG